MVWQFREDVLSRMKSSCTSLPSAATSSVTPSAEDLPTSWLPKTLTIFTRESRTQLDVATLTKVREVLRYDIKVRI